MTTTFEEILKKDGTLIYTNVGVSMMPLLRQGRDLMVIEDVQDGKDVRMGKPLKRLDSVLFRRDNGQYVLHRIMDEPKMADPIGKTVYRICGDNTMQLEPVRREQILGRLIAVDRGSGKRNIDVRTRGFRVYSWIMWGLWPTRVVYFTLRHWAGLVIKPILRSIKRKKYFFR